MNPIKKIASTIYTRLKFKPGRKAIADFRKLSDLQPQNQNNRHQRIFFIPFAPHQVNIGREGLLAHACRVRGAEPHFVFADIEFEACDFMTEKGFKDYPSVFKITRKLQEQSGIPAIYLSEYWRKEYDNLDVSAVSPEEISDYTWSGIVLGDLVIASTIRYFYCNGPEWNNPVFLQKARQNLKTAILLIQIWANFLEKEKPDKLVMSHGIYVAWGTLFRLARSKNIPVDVYGSSYRKHSLRFYHNAPNAPFPVAEWEDYAQTRLSETELKLVDDYLESRATQKDDNVALFSDDAKLSDKVSSFVEKAKQHDKKLLVLFTNISWDAYMFRQSGDSFQDMIDWLQGNINYFSNNEHYQLIIKAHPAEEYWKVPAKYRVRNFIPKNLPENILFVNELEQIKPFDLYPHMDLGLVYISTVTIEMALLGIPVLTAGVGGHYSDKGFTIDPSTKTDYFQFLTEFAQSTQTVEVDRKMAKRYMYYRFFREAIELNLVEMKGSILNGLNLVEEDIMPGGHAGIELVCEGILNDKSFLNS